MFTRIAMVSLLCFAFYATGGLCAAPYVDPVDFPSIPFMSGQSSLSPSQVKQLQEVASTLKHFSNVCVFIKGYADSSEGPAAKQREISSRRARLVYDWLAAHVAVQQLKGHKGFGAANPIDLSNTGSHRSLNPRVEIVPQ